MTAGCPTWHLAAWHHPPRSGEAYARSSPRCSSRAWPAGRHPCNTKACAPHNRAAAASRRTNLTADRICIVGGILLQHKGSSCYAMETLRHCAKYAVCYFQMWDVRHVDCLQTHRKHTHQLSRNRSDAKRAAHPAISGILLADMGQK